MRNTGYFLHFILIYLSLTQAQIAQGKTTRTCTPDSHWVKAHYRRAYTRADGTLVSAANVTAHCQKNPPGYVFWRDRIKDGKPPSWPLLSEKQSHWTAEEIEQTLNALSQLPDSLFLTSVQGIYRMAKSQTPQNPASSAPGIIVLYDGGFGSKRNLSRILSHELAHEYFRNLSKEDLDSYMMAMNWYSSSNENQGQLWISRGKTKFIEEDGMLSPTEDFANNLEYYLFQNDVLKRITPNAENWLNKHFGPTFKLKEKP